MASRPAWNSLNHDPSVYKLSPEKLLERRISSISKNNRRVGQELRKKVGVTPEDVVASQGKLLVPVNKTNASWTLHSSAGNDGDATRMHNESNSTMNTTTMNMSYDQLSYSSGHLTQLRDGVEKYGSASGSGLRDRPGSAPVSGSGRYSMYAPASSGTARARPASHFVDDGASAYGRSVLDTTARDEARPWSAAGQHREATQYGTPSGQYGSRPWDTVDPAQHTPQAVRTPVSPVPFSLAGADTSSPVYSGGRVMARTGPVAVVSVPEPLQRTLEGLVLGIRHIEPAKQRVGMKPALAHTSASPVAGTAPAGALSGQLGRQQPSASSMDTSMSLPEPECFRHIPLRQPAGVADGLAAVDEPLAVSMADSRVQVPGLQQGDAVAASLPRHAGQGTAEPAGRVRAASVSSQASRTSSQFSAASVDSACTEVLLAGLERYSEVRRRNRARAVRRQAEAQAKGQQDSLTADGTVQPAQPSPAPAAPSTATPSSDPRAAAAWTPAAVPQSVSHGVPSWEARHLATAGTGLNPTAAPASLPVPMARQDVAVQAAAAGGVLQGSVHTGQATTAEHGHGLQPAAHGVTLQQGLEPTAVLPAARPAPAPPSSASWQHLAVLDEYEVTGQGQGQGQGQEEATVYAYVPAEDALARTQRVLAQLRAGRAALAHAPVPRALAVGAAHAPAVPSPSPAQPTQVAQDPVSVRTDSRVGQPASSGTRLRWHTPLPPATRLAAAVVEGPVHGTSASQPQESSPLKALNLAERFQDVAGHVAGAAPAAVPVKIAAPWSHWTGDGEDPEPTPMPRVWGGFV